MDYMHAEGVGRDIADHGPARTAVEALVGEVEREAARARELSDRLELSNRRARALRRSAEAAIVTLPARERLHYYRRIGTEIAARPRLGRPPDARRALVLQTLAGWGTGDVTVADIRLVLERAEMGRDSRYAAHTMAEMARAGILVRIGRGRYRVEADAPAIRLERLRSARHAAGLPTGTL